ncbi:MAG: thioredoxin domain-containing protein [Saprospiraceae bacterium]|nr:thioredoxin domain-containing protein [Saprospiraceae bacterium]
MNRLQYETSPYLLQHAHNPVDWYAWKPEAFERARAENKPILVSIGYSTCHWCHVMERESFENPDVAAYMNEHYINIKVDREERPDVDAIYMEACQILTGGGGWPLNCFLTPDTKPFYAGTYFPPRPAYNRPSWLQILQHLVGVWDTQRETALAQADKLLSHIRRNDDLFLRQAPETAPAPVFHPDGEWGGTLENLFYQMRERFDRVDGGFGGAPKFPSTMAIHFLLHYHWFTGHPEAREQAFLSLDKMIQGGIYDQLGGGFARYATDREWLIPHFEKMLYDNALLVTVLSEAYKLLQSTGTTAADQERAALYRDTIEETLDFIGREMTHTTGAFFSAQDADSEGVEGKFYVWTKPEIEQSLGDEAALFCAFYGVTDAGNWEHTNILWRPQAFGAFAAEQGLETAVLKRRLRASRETLFDLRRQRIPPGLDNKVLLAWNALQVSAYAAAYTALGREEYRTAAVQNIDFLLENLRADAPLELLHTWKDGRAQYAAVLDDYAFLIAALVDIWQITFNSRYLTWAEKYTEQVLSYFHDAESNMFFFTAAGQTDILLRKKELYDNATPSGNSTMVHNLQRLGILLDRRDWREQAANMLLILKEPVTRYPLSFERWAMAMLQEAYPMLEIAVLGTNAVEKALSLQQQCIPHKVIAAGSGLGETLPLLAGKPGDEEALIYVCRDYTCQKPVQTLAEFKDLIQTI